MPAWSPRIRNLGFVLRALRPLQQYGVLVGLWVHLAYGLACTKKKTDLSADDQSVDHPSFIGTQVAPAVDTSPDD